MRDPVKALERSRRYRARQKLLHPKPPQGRHGNHARGCRNGRWNDGRLLSSHGYVLIRVPKNHHHAFGSPKLTYGYAYEHDLVMEDKIGRALRPGEVVHHKNEVKTDNHPDNLELLSLSDHMRLHAERERLEDGRFMSLRVRQFPEAAK